MESLAEHVAAFQRDGYRYIPGLFDERRICEVKYYLTMNLDALLESIRDGTCEPKVRTGHFPDRFLAREPLAGFWQDNAATDGLFSLIYPCGYNLSGFAPTARFLLPGYLAAQWPPHSDDQYGPFVGKHFVTLWIPLTRLTNSTAASASTTARSESATTCSRAMR